MRSQSQLQKQQVKRRQKQLAYKISQMSAAYAAQHQISPSEVVLVQSQVPGLRGGIDTRFHMEHHGPQAAIANSHPDLRYLWELGREIVKENDASNTENVEKVIQLMKTLFAK